MYPRSLTRHKFIVNVRNRSEPVKLGMTEHDSRNRLDPMKQTDRTRNCIVAEHESETHRNTIIVFSIISTF